MASAPLRSTLISTADFKNNASSSSKATGSSCDKLRSQSSCDPTPASSQWIFSQVPKVTSGVHPSASVAAKNRAFAVHSSCKAPSCPVDWTQSACRDPEPQRYCPVYTTVRDSELVASGNVFTTQVPGEAECVIRLKKPSGWSASLSLMYHRGKVTTEFKHRDNSYN